MRRGPALALLLTAVLAGCGGDDEDEPSPATTPATTAAPEAAPTTPPTETTPSAGEGPEDVALAYMLAFEARDAEQVCALLTPEARAAVVQVEEGEPPCSSLVGPANDDLRLESPTVRRSQVSGETATVEFNGAEQKQAIVSLLRVDGQWRVKAITA